jgi:hypothetical protein
MPPKRPRIVPSQTDLSVQDVRDYSTPEGAAMANEEMRRLKMALQATRDQVEGAAGAGQAGGAGGAGTATAEQYIWSISVNSELVGEAVPTGTKVNFIAGDGVTITRNGPNITISAVAEMSWIANADSGSVNVPAGSFARFTGLNGVTTSADTGTKSIIINRPLQIKKRGVDIGSPDTVSLDFWCEHGQHDAQATEHVYFEVLDFGDGERRIKGWVKPAGYSWDFITNTNVVETIDDAEQVSFLGGANVTVTNVGNVITISANAAAGTLQLQQEGVNIGPNDTAVINWDNDTALKPVGYTSRVWTEVINDGGGVRRLIAWYQPGAGGTYYWNLQANGGATEQIDTTETVNFAAAGNLTVARAGNTITYSYTQPAPYYWNLQASGGAIEQIDTTETVNFAASGNLAVARSGNTITYSYTQPAAYYWNLQANGGAIEQIDTTESVNFAASGNLAVARSGNTITYSYTQPAAYFWNLQANGGVIEQIDTTESVNFAAAGNLTVARSGNTITYSYTQPAAYNWVASNGPIDVTVSTTNEVTWLGDSGVTVALNAATKTFTIDRPLQIKDDGVAVGDDATVAINYDSNGGTGTSYAEFEVADVGGGERRVRIKYNAGAGQYWWNLQAAGGAIEQIDSNETVNFAAGGDLTVARVGNTITYSYTQAAYSLYAGDATTSTQVTTGEFVRWQGDSGVTVTLNAATQVFTIDRPLQLQQEGTNVGNDSTVTINWDNATVSKPVGHTGRVWTEIIDDGAGVRRLVAWYEPGAGTYYWNLQANGGAVEQIDSAESVNFTASGNLTVTRTGNTINYLYNEPAPYKWVASDGTSVADIFTGETVVITSDATATVTFNSGTQTFTISRPLTIKQSGTAVGNNNTRDINFANATLTKPAGYTSQGWIEVTDNPANGANRDIKVFFEPPTSTYGWNIEADSPLGTSAAVVNGATVKIAGANGIKTTRVNDDIFISIDPEYDPSDPAANLRISGFIEFPNNVADYIGAVPYRYGTRQYIDIAHNFDLGNQNAFELHLIDVNRNDVGTLVAYRSGATTMSGETMSDVKFRNIPHWAAIDNNTVRVWATMSRGKPTNMKFWYTLRAL